jgi:nucleotide-binding universal stress UspA family protein
MQFKVPFNSLLVPTDFSDNAWSAFQQARLLVDGDDSEIIVVHAIDPAIVNQVVQLNIGDHDKVLESIRSIALERMQPYAAVSDESTHVDTLVCEGEPFFEIIRKAEDFAVDAIVMSKLGQRNQPDSLLFGSTAEKVIRGSKKPVIVLPCNS